MNFGKKTKLHGKFGINNFELFSGIYKDKTILVTGSWLSQMGAKVVGYSLEAPTNPNHIELDIGDLDKLNEYLAAQPLVRLSYENPIETYETNVMGTLKVFEANNVKAIVNITSDKAYENKEWIWGYRENDPMGGYDPYSSSKGCADLLATSYR